MAGFKNLVRQSNEEVAYGSFAIDANPPTDSDHAWSTHENDSQD